jgi:hypothetical protein
MSIPASAENTMKILTVKHDDNNYDNSAILDNNYDNNYDNSEIPDNNSDNKSKDHQGGDNIFFKRTLNDSDDDMVVIILEEEEEEDDVQNNKDEVQIEEKHETEVETPELEKEDGGSNTDGGSNGSETDFDGNKDVKNEKIITPKQKYIGSEVYTHLQQTLESQKLYPLLPCNMISSFARVMEYVEYFDIPSEDRRKLVIDLVKILAYSNNDYGSRECFEYFAEHNMIDDIIKTIIDGTKNRYDINRFPHTNRKIVLSCVSLSNKIKIVKPNAKIESLFEEFKLNLCGLKRFFKPKDKEESKQT